MRSSVGEQGGEVEARRAGGGGGGGRGQQTRLFSQDVILAKQRVSTVIITVQVGYLLKQNNFSMTLQSSVS